MTDERHTRRPGHGHDGSDQQHDLRAEYRRYDARPGIKDS